MRKNDNDSLTIGQYEGKYPEFVYPKTLGYTVHGIKLANGYTLTVNRTEGDNVIYAFAPDTVTAYGNIPAEYDISAYPFALFKTDKTFIGGYAEWGAAVNAAVANNVKTILAEAGTNVIDSVHYVKCGLFGSNRKPEEKEALFTWVDGVIASLK